MSITRNAARCNSCGDEIESKYTHDYQTCSCGRVSVDGGHAYLKRAWPGGEPDDWFEDLASWDCNEGEKV